MNVAGFYSDPHFGHKNIIEFCERPFDTINHMEQELILRYNRLVKDTDLIVWVGDVAFYMGALELKCLLQKMNGYKVLVMGNHDYRRGRGFMAKAGFDLVIEKEMFICIKGRTCRICHYPYWEGRGDSRKKDSRYPERVKGEVLIHGHSHAPYRHHGNMIHVGIDAWDYGPAMMPAVEELVARV